MVILCLVSAPAWGIAQAVTSQEVDRVVSLYYQGKFKEAELLALRTLQSPELLPPVDKALLHKTLGFTYVAMGENEKAKIQFLAWLDLDPLAQLDPIYVSPKIIAVFKEAQHVYILSKTQAQPANQAALNQQLEALKRSLFFPGLGQLYRGQQVKGFSLLAAEVVLLGGFALCQSQYAETRDRYLTEINPAQMESLYDEVNLYYRAKYAAAILAAGVYLYSLYDALFLPPNTPSRLTQLQIKFNPQSATFLGLIVKF